MNGTTNGRMPMVDWYDPRQLIETGRKTAISSIVGENADPRLVNAAAADGRYFDYSKELSIDANGEFQPDGAPRTEIWVDYVSDVGDGWNSTYSVAYSLAQPALTVSGETTQRGEILVFGGDEVYPTATSDEYERRLVEPYRQAFNAARGGTTPTNIATETDLKNVPHVFALPGNHDWYDSLVAFQKLFCARIFNQGIFAGAWRTRQKQSYFALRLPHGWWILAVDLQLSHSVDTRQLEYFEAIGRKMNAGDKVILVVPEPYWVKAIKYQGLTDEFEKKEESIGKIEEMFSANGVEIKVYIAGDLHHYRRFESHDGKRTQKITAGGGGAFLHPTHDFDYRKRFARKAVAPTDFTLETDYPTMPVSRSLDWKNLHSFARNNRTFGILTAILYSLLAFLIHGQIVGEFTWLKALDATVVRCLEEPLALIVVILMMMGLIFFTDSNSTIYRRVAGAIHGLTHLSAIFFLGWLGFLLMRWFIEPQNYNNAAFLRDSAAFVNVVWFFSILLVCGIGGYVIGSIIMGLYLFVSLHIFGRHDNEAFSAMKIPDFRNFVRLHIDKKGGLTIYPVKIDRSARKWKDDKANHTCHPAHNLKPELIEDPVTI